MRRPLNYCAAAQGIATPQEPRRNEATAGGTPRPYRDQQDSKAQEIPSTRHCGRAFEVIEGEAYGRAFLQRLRAGTSGADELADILEFLQGDMLRGACRVIEKALGVQHG